MIIAAPLAAINLSVAICGRSVVFPLSPFHLREKVVALAKYARHRPRCLFEGHPPIAPLVAHAEARHRLPRGFLAAVIEVESGGRVHRISPAGAMGPGQLSAATARGLGVDDPFDPAENLDGSARYLAAQLSAFHDLRLAAAAYNAGPGAVVNRTIPRNGETEIYVRRVMHAMAEQRRAAGAVAGGRRTNHLP
jgi:soluble lytic murein transglycosylase-like protein